VTDDEQLCLPGMQRATAEYSRGKTRGVDGEMDRGRPRSVAQARPKARSNERRNAAATMAGLVEGLDEAFRKVASNKGAAGPDRQSIEAVRKRWDDLKAAISAELLAGRYKPGDIRRVTIPKAGGGERGLGIPNVIDRVVQEAVRREIEMLYEPTFHRSNHGFRRNRSCHTAIMEAKKYVEDGYEWVVDLDLEKFFDRVNHQRLMARLSSRVKDRQMLVLVGRMLKAKVVMPDGVVQEVEEGVPQGGPLSPLLSNIVLDELDEELARRGHRFVRYADDCNVYVKSRRAGERVMASLSRFIGQRLRLRVNEAKSAVAQISERQFLGFQLRREPMEGVVEVLPSKRSMERLGGRIRELTPRNWGSTIDCCISQLNQQLRGWVAYQAICSEGVETMLRWVDAHIRRRLRAIQLKQWKRKRTIVRNLIWLGVKPKTAWRGVYKGRKGPWKLSHSPAVDRGLRNAKYAERGLVSLAKTWRELNAAIDAPVQLMLALV
jgi:RNA-directed DNA polymerase